VSERLLVIILSKTFCGVILLTVAHIFPAYLISRI